jgi:hypothetical protein
VYQYKQVEFNRGTRVNRKTKSKSKLVCVPIYVQLHEGVPACVGILSYILNLEVRKGDWLALSSGRLIFWEITIGASVGP